MKLSKNSWHYKINCLAGRKYELKYVNDFCTYFWKTLISIFIVIFTTILLVSVATLLIFQWKIVIPGLVGVFIFAYLMSKYEDYKYHKEFYGKEEKSVGFFKATWRKFKDKTCHKIEWE